MTRTLVLLFAFACSQPKKAPTMSTQTCAAALDMLLAKDLASWTGLPKCTLADFAKLELGEDESRGLLGKEGITTYYRRAKAPTYAETMKLWVRDGAVVRISIPLPELADPRALVRTLAEPEATLDTYFTTSPTVHKQGEYVYASRGLALVLSFDRSTVMELIVFPATTVDDYVRRLRFSEPPREISD